MDPQKKWNRQGPNGPPAGIPNGWAAGLWNGLAADLWNELAAGLPNGLAGGLQNIARGCIERALTPPPPPPPPPPPMQIYIKNMVVKAEQGKEKNRGHVHQKNCAKVHGRGTDTQRSIAWRSQASDHVTQQSQTRASHSFMTNSKQSGTTSKQSGMGNTGMSGQSSSTRQNEKGKGKGKCKDNMKGKNIK